jgi:hypothetical protein
VAEGVEVASGAWAADRQLCDGPRVSDAVTPLTGAHPSPIPAVACDEGQLYRCAGGLVVACSDSVALVACARGCISEGAAIDDDETVTREAAFAILCSR